MPQHLHIGRLQEFPEWQISRSGEQIKYFGALKFRRIPEIMVNVTFSNLIAISYYVSVFIQKCSLKVEVIEPSQNFFGMVVYSNFFISFSES